MADELHRILKTRLEELDNRARGLQESIARLQAESAKVAQQREVYRTALVLEGVTLPSEIAVAQVLSQKDRTSAASKPADETKSDAIRRFIATSGANGVDAKQVADYVRRNGISIHQAFAYNVIKRLKDAGELLSDGSRYFPTGKLLEALGQERTPFKG